MKKGMILLVILTISNIYSQNYTYEDKTMTGIFDVKDKSQSELFSLINKWISINYNSSKDVIQLNDKEAGNIIVKGVNENKFRSVWNAIKPKTIEFIPMNFYHTIEINVKDNKYRVIYTITDTVDPLGNLYLSPNGFFDMVGFNGIKQEQVDNYNNSWTIALKGSAVGKKKRQIQQDQTRSIFEELNKNLITSIELTMLSIQEVANSTREDDF